MSEFHAGQTVQITRPIRAMSVSDYYTTHNFKGGELVTVTRVYTKRIQVRHSDHSWSLDITAVADPSSDIPVPRQPGEAPEGTLEDGTPFISPDHPGLRWLWDDIAVFAKESRYCNEFDRIAEELSLPIRKRRFTARTTIDGLTVSASFEAYTQAEANAMFEEKLAATRLDTASATS